MPYTCFVEFNENQITNLGKYLLDISKMIAGIYVFTSFPDKLLVGFFGLICAIIFLLGGLMLLKGEQK
jgi:hypothetical protein